jgi:hypothetical protein
LAAASLEMGGESVDGALVELVGFRDAGLSTPAEEDPLQPRPDVHADAEECRTKVGPRVTRGGIRCNRVRTRSRRGGWCAWQESNLLPHAPQACALSGELQARKSESLPADPVHPARPSTATSAWLAWTVSRSTPTKKIV